MVFRLHGPRVVRRSLLERPHRHHDSSYDPCIDEDTMIFSFTSRDHAAFSASAAALAALFLATAPASAHVTLATAETGSGNYYKGILRVPHGCDGKATRSVSVQIPEGVIGVKPMPKPGWTVTMTKGAYAKTYENHGRAVTEGVREIVWSGGELGDEFYDEFVFTSFVTDTFAAGQRVYFPTVQTCTQGEARWTEVPAAGQSARDLKSPAPALRIADTRMNAQAQASAGAETYKIGDITVAAPWSRATPGGAKVAGGYLKVTNSGSAPERLVSATASAASRVEIHEMSMVSGVMRMRPLNDGLIIKPGETVELKPGGFHMMFMDIKQPFKQGDAIKVTLQFEKAGKLDVVFNVGAVAASGGGDHSGHKHHH